MPSVLAKAQLLEGTARDDADQAVPYASVYLEEFSRGAATGGAGEFSLCLSRGGVYRVIASAISYVRAIDTHDLTLASNVKRPSATD